MNVKAIENLLRTSALLALAGLLASCGESTNIAGNEGGGLSSCSSMVGVTCVAGRLVDEAVANVDYECGLPGSGTVRSVTGDDGSFSCPNGSTVTFSLTNPDSPSNKIVLGQVVVSRTAKIYGDNPPPVPIYFYVTPLHLAGEDAESGFGPKSTNIARLLQTLGADPAVTDPDLPSRHLVISDADKRKITAATISASLDFSDAPASNADLANPPAGTFDYAVKDFLQSLADPAKHQLISKDTAQTMLQKGIHSTVAGIYSSGPSILITATQQDTDLGAMIGAGSGKVFVGQFWNLVDRRGRMIGSGVYSYGTSSSSQPWAIWSDPQPLELSASGLAHVSSGVPVWPNNGDLTKMQYALRGAADAGKVVRINQGKMRREAIAGSANIFTNLFEETATDEVLGKWSLEDNTTSYISSGKYTLEHTVPVATWMNPDLWKPATISFPIPILVSFYNSDVSNPACSDKGCKIADVRMVILKDGNIISDFSHRCGVNIDPVTLKYPDRPNPPNPPLPGEQEVPLGVVSNILNTLKDETGSTITTMTLLAMLPRHPSLVATDPSYNEFLPYIQFGSNLGDNSLLRVDGTGSKRLQLYGKCIPALKNRAAPLTPLCTTLGAFEPEIASWVNAYTFTRAIKANSMTPAPANKDALNFNAGGLMASRKLDSSECVP